MNRRGFTLLAVLAAAVTALVGYAGLTKRSAERSVELVESLTLHIPPGARGVRLWMPKPPNDEFQSAALLEVESPWPHRITQDPEFGNETFYFHAQDLKPQRTRITLRYRIVRRRQEPGLKSGPPADIHLRPRGLVVVNDDIRRIAQETTAGLSEPMDKAKALYHYVLSHVSYDKSGSGWGRGDSVYACKVGKGNCTDFHALFMALSIAGGIPSRFRMGYSLTDEGEGEVAGYHCWAEFYAAGKGWVPVDISEAWKHPRRAEDYFGNLDPGRVLVSTGREIRLSPPQRGRPLNFLSRPYAEMDGKPLYDLEFTRKYKTL